MTAASEYLLWALVSFGIGYCLVELCAIRSSERIAALQICLGFGLGLGVAAVVYFASIVFFGGKSLAFLWMDIALLAVLLAGRIFRTRPGSIKAVPVSPHVPYRDILIPVLAIMGSAFLLMAILRNLSYAHGGWDAWMIWNMRARWIFRSGAEWSATAFSPLLANTDYPLLLPSTVLQGWNLLGGESTYIPFFIGLAFELGLAALLLAVLWRLTSPIKAILGTLVLTATPIFMELGGYQYADVPLAYFFLATLAFIGLHDSVTTSKKLWLGLAGFSAGLCCWTKNEGVLFIGCIVVARILTSRSTGFRELLKEFLYFSLGVSAPIAVLFYFKHTFAPPSVMFGSQTIGGFISQLADSGRHALIFPALVREILGFGRWRFSPLPFLAFYALAAGVNRRHRHPRFLATCVAVFIMMLAGYYTVYLTEAVSIAGLSQHLATSLNRLMFQLWPIFILIYFLGVRSPIPDEADAG